MFYLVKVLIGRSIVSLDRSFSYWTDDETIQSGMRVMVSFGNSKATVGFVMESPEKIDEEIEDYSKKSKIKYAKIISKIDQEPIFDDELMALAKDVAYYYKSDLIKVLSAFLPPSLKPRNSALKKPQAKTLPFVFVLPYDGNLTAKESALYQKIQKEKDGILKSKISAKVSLGKLIEKKAVEVKEVPVSRIPEMVYKKLPEFDLTEEQRQAYELVLNTDKQVSLLEGVTGSGKTEVYLKLCKHYLEQGKGALVLLPEISLSDHMADLFAASFTDTVSILNSSLSEARRYDEYIRIKNGESKIVLGTRSAVFAPVENLGIIIIDEEHSSSYKQDNDPYYDAIEVSKMRAKGKDIRIVLGSATPRVIDKARAEKGIYQQIYMKKRFSKNQEQDLIIVNMNDNSSLDPRVSSMVSKRLQEEIVENLRRKEQTMILINRRGYSPIYVCQDCNKTALCPNCQIPLSYHKRDDTLRCHHCGYETSSIGYTCENCKSKSFITLGYGTERATEEIKMLFPQATITRLDSDISSKEVRHQILFDFAKGSTDILVGTQVIAKGHNFPNVTLAAILDADSSLRLPTYMANEETFDLISQFVGRAGRGEKKGRVLLQSYIPDNPVITMAANQDYASFYRYEMEERRKYMYPPYVYMASISIRSIDQKRVNEVSLAVKNYLLREIGNKRFNLYGPTAPYVPHINGRYYRNILVKFKSREEANPIFDGLKVLRLANKDAEISVDMDPGMESL